MDIVTHYQKRYEKQQEAAKELEFKRQIAEQRRNR